MRVFTAPTTFGTYQLGDVIVVLGKEEGSFRFFCITSGTEDGLSIEGMRDLTKEI